MARGHFFGEDGHLAGLPVRRGKHAGKWRPAKRTTELQEAERKKKLKKLKDISGKVPVAPLPPGAKIPSLAPSLPAGAKLPTALPSGAKAPSLLPSSSSPTGGSVPTGGVKPVALQPVAPPPTPVRPIAIPSPPPPPPPAPAPLPIVPKISSSSTAAKLPSFSLRGLAGLLGAAFMDGLGADDTTTVVDDEPDTNPTTADTSYQPNASVWVSVEPQPFYWWGPSAGSRQSTSPRSHYGAQSPNGEPVLEPVYYPDGTPVVGRIWLPKADLRQVDPNLYRGWVRRFIVASGNPRLDPNQIASQLPGPDDVYEFAPPQPWMAGYLYYGVNQTGLQGEVAGMPPTGGPSATRGTAEESIPFENYGYYDIRANFDWSKLNPSVQAYPWLYDNFAPDGRVLAWVEQPADLWRSDGHDLAESGMVFLGLGAGKTSPLLHCVEFVDALVLGLHGMPKVVSDDGVFDQAGLIAWCRANPPWDRLADVFSQGGPLIMATVYDNKPVTVPKASALPPPSEPTGEVTPTDGSAPTSACPDGYYQDGDWCYPIEGQGGDLAPQPSTPTEPYYEQPPTSGQPAPYPSAGPSAPAGPADLPPDLPYDGAQPASSGYGGGGYYGGSYGGGGYVAPEFVDDFRSPLPGSAAYADDFYEEPDIVLDPDEMAQWVVTLEDGTQFTLYIYSDTGGDRYFDIDGNEYDVTGWEEEAAAAV